MRKVNVKIITFMAMGAALNVLLTFLAVVLKLPIYMDSVGTILIACLLGSKYGVITGLISSFVSGATFDVYAFYFAPVQITTGYLSGVMYKKGYLNGYKKIIGVLIFSLPTALISAAISAYVFGGITSSGSTYIIQILTAMKIPLVLSAFLVQIVTEYIDKFIALIIVLGIIKTIKSSSLDRS